MDCRHRRRPFRHVIGMDMLCPEETVGDGDDQSRGRGRSRDQTILIPN